MIGPARPAPLIARPAARPFRLSGNPRSLSGLAAGLRIRAARKILQQLDLVAQLPDLLEELGNPLVSLGELPCELRIAALQPGESLFYRGRRTRRRTGIPECGHGRIACMLLLFFATCVVLPEPLPRRSAACQAHFRKRTGTRPKKTRDWDNREMPGTCPYYPGSKVETVFRRGDTGFTFRQRSAERHCSVGKPQPAGRCNRRHPCSQTTPEQDRSLARKYSRVPGCVGSAPIAQDPAPAMPAEHEGERHCNPEGRPRPADSKSLPARIVQVRP